MQRKLPITILVLLVVAASAAAPVAGHAQSSKVPLTHDVYDSWRSIRGAQLSDDGAWLLYGEVPQDGDADLVVQELASGVEHRVGLGYLSAGGGFPRVEAEFIGDGHVVLMIAPTKAEIEQAEEDDKTGKDAPKKSLGILDLATGELDTIERVKNFRAPADGGGWIAYLMEDALADLEAPEGATEEPEATEPEPAAEPEPGEPTEPASEEAEDEEDSEREKKEPGTELRVRWLDDGSEVHVVAVLDYHAAADGSQLLFTVSSEDAPDTDGVYALAAASREVRPLLTGEGNYRHLSLSPEGDRFAFVTDRADYGAEESAFELWGGGIDADAADLWVSHDTTEGFPAGMAVSDKEGISFADSGALVMFGIRALPEDAGDDAGEEDGDDRARFDLWHWQDPYPQPQQLLVAEERRNETFESVWWIDEGRFVQLADETLPDVSLSESGAVAMGRSDARWSDRHSYEGFFNDVYVVDSGSGERTLVAERVSSVVQLSPSGRYLIWFGGDGEWVGYDRDGAGGFANGQDWFLYDTESGERHNLTDGLDVGMEWHDWDQPNLPGPYGSAGFTDDEGAVVIYDRYDLWSFPTAGGEPTRVTEGVGREHATTFRWARTDPDVATLSTEEPLLLTATNEETMATAFWVDRIGTGERPVELLGADARLDFVDRADGADTLLFTRQTFSEFPDLWVGQLRGGDTPELAAVRRVTDLGAQTDPYLWGSAELRDFRSADGLPLKGILVKPENFDPERKYPLMVYIYETMHPTFHFFRAPSPGTSTNASYYASNDYIVWMPDIRYVTPGYPGRDAMKCVLPGINMLVNEGFIDPEAIGIQGHSWGGYQIAYMITQTDIFAAVEAGAPVSNMTSAYGGIRWGSGLVRQFQYERTQSRLGASLWEVPLRYIENSPIFWADDVNTPVLMLHNDDDGAVPWYQGIEFMMALRRLGKESYMFNYNGEAHGLRQRVNQKDWTVRMQQFFDHHLRGAPAPEWMTDGIRGWEKGEVDR